MMLNPDSLGWLGIPLAIVLWVLFLAPFVRAMFHAPADPDPEYSRLDRMDGLGSHTG